MIVYSYRAALLAATVCLMSYPALGQMATAIEVLPADAANAGPPLSGDPCQAAPVTPPAGDAPAPAAAVGYNTATARGKIVMGTTPDNWRLWDGLADVKSNADGTVTVSTGRSNGYNLHIVTAVPNAGNFLGKTFKGSCGGYYAMQFSFPNGQSRTMAGQGSGPTTSRTKYLRGVVWHTGLIRMRGMSPRLR